MEGLAPEWVDRVRIKYLRQNYVFLVQKDTIEIQWAPELCRAQYWKCTDVPYPVGTRWSNPTNFQDPARQAQVTRSVLRAIT